MQWVGDRILLRRPVEADMDTVFEKWASDPEVTRYMAWPTHTQRDDADALLFMSDKMWDAHECGPMLIEHRDTGEIMGSAGLMFGEVYAQGDDDVGVGYVLRREFWGCGYATEALALSIEAAREKGIKRLVAGIHPANMASRRVCKKAGFTLDIDQPSGNCAFPQISPDGEQPTVRYVLDL